MSELRGWHMVVYSSKMTKTVREGGNVSVGNSSKGAKILGSKVGPQNCMM